MAPDTVSSWLTQLPRGSRVLDPMCGSGVVVRQSALLGHKAVGFDIDPLAVLMSRVWTHKGSHESLNELASKVVASAMRRRAFSHTNLPWVAQCPETLSFVEYWFSEPQRSMLARIAWAIRSLKQQEEEWASDCLWLALSRIIITKHVGASLAWDVSHSRPHRKREENDFDVLNGFTKAVARLSTLLDGEPIQKAGVVRRGDCRQLRGVKHSSVDAVITSPPYLNAIDYLRGHKLALVWMGYSIPELRRLRSSSIGTERAKDHGQNPEGMRKLESAVRSIQRLPQRQRSIVHKYAVDASLMLSEMKRVLSPEGLLVLVLGDSNLRGVPVYNSRIFKHLARECGFVLESEYKHPLASDRRYLPMSDTSGALANRMKLEVLQAYRISSSA
ncbi:MAG TPA: hypothetical protein PKE16_02805 [Hyphomicrobium sp.]|nr:hypothetical protein [Hyphomicrobium sp.]